MMRALPYMIGAVTPRGASLIIICMLSSFLSQRDFGLYALAIAVGEFSDIVSSTWFRVSVLRFYHDGKMVIGRRNDLSAVFQTTILCIAAAIILSIVASSLLAVGVFAQFAVACTLYVIGNGAVQGALNIFRGEDKAWEYATVEIVRPALMLTACVTVQLLGYASFAAAALFVFGAHAAVGMAVFGVTWMKRRKGVSASRWIIDAYAFGWPLLVSTALLATMNLSDRYFLQKMIGPDAVAVYAIAYTIGRQPIDLIFYAINVRSFTRLMAEYDRNGRATAEYCLGRHIVTLLAVAAPATAGLTVLAGPIMQLCFNDRYWASAPPLVPLIAMSAVFAGVKSYGFDQSFHMAKKLGRQMLTLIPATLASLVLGFVFVSYVGIKGAAFGILAGNAVSLCVSAALAARLVPAKMPWLELVKIAVATGVMFEAVCTAPWNPAQNWASLLGAVTLGVVAYGVASLALNLLDLRGLALMTTTRVLGQLKRAMSV